MCGEDKRGLPLRRVFNVRRIIGMNISFKAITLSANAGCSFVTQRKIVAELECLYVWTHMYIHKHCDNKGSEGMHCEVID